jgi:hypothetical protein
LLATWADCFLVGTNDMEERLIEEFIERWARSGGAERANYQLFLAELCQVLDVPRPEPTVEDDSQNAYVFERNVQFDNLDGTYSTCRIDLYKRGCFVLESKQGVQQQETAPVLSAKQQQRRAIAAELPETPAKATKAAAAKAPWPKSLSAQAAAVQTALAEQAAPATEAELAKRFTSANKDRIAELLETLASLGKARQLEDGRYVPV